MVGKIIEGHVGELGFTFKVLCYVKDECTNLVSMTTALMLVISYEALNLLQLFDGTCFGHAMSKVAQYAIDDDRISKNLALMSVKFAQTSLQSCITWPKKIGMLTIFNFCNSSNF